MSRLTYKLLFFTLSNICSCLYFLRQEPIIVDELFKYTVKSGDVSDIEMKINNAAVKEEMFQQERKYQNTNKGDVHSDTSWKIVDSKEEKLDGREEEKVATNVKKGKEGREEKEDKVLVGEDNVDVRLISKTELIYRCGNSAGIVVKVLSMH